MDLGVQIRMVFVPVAHVLSIDYICKVVLRILWHCVHLVVSIWYFVLRMVQMLQSHIISSGLLVKYKSLDLSNLHYLAVVVDSEEAQHTSRILKLLSWLASIGVKHVSLYDMDGVLKESKGIIFEKLGCKRTWEEVDEKISLLEGKPMKLEFVSSCDGKEGAAKAASFLFSKYLKAANSHGNQEGLIITEPDMTNALKAVGCGGPEPDILLIYGPVRCHLGFPAWRLRYTEFVHMGPLKSMSYGSVIKAIHKFTKVHQNYGS
ncbi:PREDICTED: dehydrodolichyl diphosphate synthase complex subunit NUS1 isoform X2 [Nelumbo nucifera]|nr:PREDICTED: dehydrodolichyl diphosphate synthase complex subunit NUS1 isoform X2 [Nelumbo nucifera]